MNAIRYSTIATSIWLALALGCGGKISPLRDTDAGQIVFDCYSVNFAWGYKLRGSYINRYGEIFKYNRDGDPWLPESVKRGSSTIPAEDLLDKFRNVVRGGQVEPDVLREKFALVEAAAQGKLTTRPHLYDAGGSGCVAYLYDPTQDSYEKITLASGGNFLVENSTREANLLNRWLRELFRPTKHKSPDSESLRKCAEHAKHSETWSPRSMSIGNPPLLSVDAPDGWYFDSYSRPVSWELILREAGVPVKESHCSVGISAELRLGLAHRCRKVSTVSECANIISPVLTVVEPRPIELAAGEGIEYVVEADVHFREFPTGVYILHDILFQTPVGIALCSLRVEPDRYAQYESVVAEFCGSMRLF